MYKYTSQVVPNRAAGVQLIHDTLISAGWQLVDDESALGYRVYSSNGELSDRIPEVVQVDWQQASGIRFRAYYGWIAATNTGLGQNTNASLTIGTSETGFLLYIYGDKDIFGCFSRVGTTWNGCLFGHWKKRFWNVQTKLTAPAQSGSNVVLQVENANDFIVGRSYQIVGTNNEGRDWVTVTAKGSNTLTISNLPRSYSVGSIIGICPSTFGMIGPVTTLTQYYPTCPYSAVGTATVSTTGTIRLPIETTTVDPDQRINQYVIQPFILPETSDSIGCYVDSMILYCSTVLANEDTLSVNNLITSTVTSATVNTLTDTTKNLSGMTNKVVVITTGQGAGQIRRIISSTINQITVERDWVTIPNNTSGYVICDEAYRHIMAGYVCREGI